MEKTPREIRALDIAARFKIIESSGEWLVPSQTGVGKYAVKIEPELARCTCPDHELRLADCKHIMAVKYTIERERKQDGSVIVTETFEVVQKKTYKQDWPNYNAAQVEEKDRFQILLRDLCNGIPQPEYKGNGRPSMPLSDVAFAAAFKIYSTFSGRRFMSDLRESKERNHVEVTPHYNSIFRYLGNESLTPLLKDLIIQSSLPLQSVEQDFAVDSSGFSVGRFERWFDHKWGKERLRHEWVKVHIMCGVKTNIVTAVEIHGKDASDVRQLPALVATTDKHFTMSEVSGDKAYLSAKNLGVIRDTGAMPFIAFKNNSTDLRETGKNSKVWRDMFGYFLWKHDEFLAHYHKRSNVESTFSMIKRKFGDSLRSKTDTAMVNEALCKILCHNLVVLIHEIHELGIEPLFEKREANV